jgi:hypothetical protein
MASWNGAGDCGGVRGPKLEKSTPCWLHGLALWPPFLHGTGASRLAHGHPAPLGPPGTCRKLRSSGGRSIPSGGLINSLRNCHGEREISSKCERGSACTVQLQYSAIATTAGRSQRKQGRTYEQATGVLPGRRSPPAVPSCVLRQPRLRC